MPGPELSGPGCIDPRREWVLSPTATRSLREQVRLRGLGSWIGESSSKGTCLQLPHEQVRDLPSSTLTLGDRAVLCPWKLLQSRSCRSILTGKSPPPSKGLQGAPGADGHAVALVVVVSQCVRGPKLTELR